MKRRSSWTCRTRQSRGHKGTAVFRAAVSDRCRGTVVDFVHGAGPTWPHERPFALDPPRVVRKHARSIGDGNSRGGRGDLDS